MDEYDLHSFIIACDFRVDDLELMWEWLEKHRDGLSAIGAHHVVVYESIWEPRRVLVTIGIRQARSIREVLRSPAIFEWFNISGADDIPPIFGGEVVERGDVARGGGHLVPAFERRDRPFAAEAARCSRDEPDFSTHVRLQCAYRVVAFPVCEVHR